MEKTKSFQIIIFWIFKVSFKSKQEIISSGVITMFVRLIVLLSEILVRKLNKLQYVFLFPQIKNHIKILLQLFFRTVEVFVGSKIDKLDALW